MFAMKTFVKLCVVTALVPGFSGFASAKGIDGPRASTAPAHGGKVTVPVQTAFTVKLDEALSIKTAGNGEGFTVTFTEPVEVDGVTVIPAGASGAGIVNKPRQDNPQMELNSIFVNGRLYRVATSPITFNQKTSLPPGSKFTFRLVFALNVAK